MKAVVIIAALLTTVALSDEFLGVIPDVQPEEVLSSLVPVGYTASGVLVVGRDRAALEQQGGRLIDTAPQQRVYYRVPLGELLAAPQITEFATILYSDEQDCYLRLDEADIERLITLVRFKSRIWLRPLVLNNRRVSLPPVSANPLVEQMVQNVRADSVLSYVRRLQRYRTRYSTSDSCRAAAEWIRQKFLAYGCDSVYFEYHTSGHAPNVIGIRYGTAGQRNPYAIIDGHFDSYAPSNAPGADDNASGVAATIEACRVMQPYRFNRDLRYIAFSGEEFGLYGSEYYAAMARSRGDSILGVLNFDMIGYVDAMPEDLQLVTKIANPPCGPFSDWFTAVADTYTDLICTKYMVNDNQNSDHGPFWNNGYVAFCGIEDFWPVNPYYHTPGDSIGAGYNNNGWCTEVTRAAVAALATLGQPVPLNRPLLGFLRSRVQDSAGNNDGFWDPGESVAVYVTLKNFGMVTATGVTATISTSDPYVTLFSTNSGYGSIAPQETAVSLQPYLMRAAANTPKEHVASFTLNIVSAESSWVANFDLTIGRYLVTDPVPDGPRQPPLYWAYDDIDTGYAQHPVFDWIEIRQQGTRLNYSHNDEVIAINLPSGFGPIYFYGQRYTQVSVSADGWVAMGNYTTRHYTNTSLPNSSAPRAAVFANWDDLDPVVAGAVYYWHDPANHRLIIEYDSVAYYNPNTVRDKFEIIFYDTTLAPASGDNVILLQYLTANRYSSSTIGLQDHTQTIAICDLFNGTYAHGAAPIAARRAIRLVTELTGLAESGSGYRRRPSQLLLSGTIYLAPAEFVPGCGLYDPAGRRVLSLRAGINRVGNLPAGVYFLRSGQRSVRTVIAR